MKVRSQSHRSYRDATNSEDDEVRVVVVPESRPAPNASVREGVFLHTSSFIEFDAKPSDDLPVEPSDSASEFDEVLAGVWKWLD